MKKVVVFGYTGLLGQSLVKRLQEDGVGLRTPGHEHVELRDASRTWHYLMNTAPDTVFMVAGTVGGIQGNIDRPAEFIFDNVVMAASVIEACRSTQVKKLVLVGSSCIYPKHGEVPIREEALLTGPLEETNRPYAVGKIAAIEMASAYRRQYGCDFISAMACNLYGENDHFEGNGNHVLPALVKRFVLAKRDGDKIVRVWGSGLPKREFLHADDAADALVFLAENYSGEGPINVGTGTDISISALAGMIADIVGYDGQIVFDISKPDGTARKVLDVTRITALGWSPTIALKDGIIRTVQGYQRTLT